MMRYRTIAAPAAIVLGLAALALLAATTTWHDLFDLRVYRGAIRSWAGGADLYDYVLPGTRYGFTYWRHEAGDWIFSVARPTIAPAANGGSFRKSRPAAPVRVIVTPIRQPPPLPALSSIGACMHGSRRAPASWSRSATG